VSQPEQPILPIQRLAAVIEVILTSGFPTQIALIVALRGLGLAVRTADDALNPAFIFTLSLLDAAVIVALVLFFLYSHRESARDLLLGTRPPLREAAIGVAIIPAVFLAVILILAFLLTFAPWLHNVPRNPLEDLLTTRRDALIFAVVVMIAGGVREEIQRAFILHRFGQYLGGMHVGLAVHSVVFGLGHIDQGYDAAIATGTLGLMWGLLFIARRSVVAPMVSHAGFNVLQLAKFLVGIRA
jgi:membrane protease YdiL (CAAX protease family)